MKIYSLLWLQSGKNNATYVVPSDPSLPQIFTLKCLDCKQLFRKSSHHHILVHLDPILARLSVQASVLTVSANESVFDSFRRLSKMLLFLSRLNQVPPPCIYFSFVTDLPGFTPLKDWELLEVSANVLRIFSLHRGYTHDLLVIELTATLMDVTAEQMPTHSFPGVSPWRVTSQFPAHPFYCTF